MSLNIYPVIITVATFIMTFVGGSFAARKRSSIGLLTAFASGVLIAVSLFDILPESIRLSAETNMEIDYLMSSLAIGFLLLYGLHRFIFIERPGSVKEHTHRAKHGGLLATSVFCAHSYFEGLAIGLGFLFDIKVGIFVSIAVLVHDLSDGLSTVTLMLASGNSLRSSQRMLLVDAATPILGALSTLFLTVSTNILVIILPFFAGGLLYLGASDLLPEATDSMPSRRTYLAIVIGFIFIFIITSITN